MAGGGPILIVDDDADIRDALIYLLTAEGYAVQGAANGREAIDLLSQGVRPKLILLDLRMPVMNGWEFLDERRKNAEWASIPVVALSAGYYGRTVADEVAAFLQKPVDLEELLGFAQRFAA